MASDHAGVELKSQIVKELLNFKWLPDVKREVHDLGPQSLDSVDFPDYADLVAHKIHGFSLVQDNTSQSLPTEVGILICGSGQGMAMRANKYPHIRAALCWSPEVARLSREHNDANVLCLGSRVTTPEINLQCLEIFLTTPFSGGRHARRVAKVSTPV
ncbi:MAG: RpiB/LacA/LacB family sugar-phosphate isomerase [Pseudobdellovibrionaceae bacterium]